MSIPETVMRERCAGGGGVTHAELVDLACRWLHRVLRCPVVVGELVSGCAETPDALGWHGRRSVLVECKTSRADFLADAKKSFRLHPDSGLGDFRYFLAPVGLIRAAELPAGWGLLEPAARCGIRVVRRSHADGCPCRDRRPVHYCLPPFLASPSDRLVLMSLVRRLAGVGVRGGARFLVSPYIRDERGAIVNPPPFPPLLSGASVQGGEG